LERLYAVKAAVLGVVLNAVDLRNPEYAYYDHYYGSGYGASEEPMGDIDMRPTQEVGGSETIEAPLLIASSTASAGPELVSPAFINVLIERLAEQLGPIAAFVVRERITALGESMDSFPKSRVHELIQKLREEILNEKSKYYFMKAMAQEMHSL
jgi:hypothetical protein